MICVNLFLNVSCINENYSSSFRFDRTDCDVLTLTSAANSTVPVLLSVKLIVSIDERGADDGSSATVLRLGSTVDEPLKL